MSTPSTMEASNLAAPTSTWEIFKAQFPSLNVPDEESPPLQDLSDPSLLTPAYTISSGPLPTQVNLTDETAFLLQTYLRTVARWMDIMDFQNTYQLSIPRLTLTSPLLFNCICAFTAKQLSLANSRKNWSWDTVARDFYGQSLRLLISTLTGSSSEHALTATILLSSYEILAALGSESQRRHLLGATTLIKAHGITAQSHGIDRANFWIYIRHDICVALSIEKPILLHPDDWNVRWEVGEMREDVLGNQGQWILGRVVTLVYGEEGRTEAGKEKRENFLVELEEWRSRLPDAFIGIPYGEPDDEGLRKIYFTVTAAAAAAFWYHVTHILLYAEPVLQDPSYIPHIQVEARKIASIAVSEFPDSLRVFSTHGLYYGMLIVFFTTPTH
ncbi:hypothetical protein BU24DRAFT_112852 [Aaosphaeria arxii CBS 175.79]|uniref:Transcription factor domain-containing protein n=1 Tax=Aaosphaeria arxii CBS 175.79 TaxID=1450172 RepID=A0A6A5Y0P5_9PLEO|nr:uncharacterized protein BU24DRAFT_112852 [Aaosphaeria arxii CBS 175.79]KAF2019115.1 hypothetical protein BU24DRAFT_112852 [Aaosphaeria arxii CBS 175.79]